MCNEDDISGIVIDNGSCVCKMGYAGEDLPKCRVSTVLGRQLHKPAMLDVNLKDPYIGDLAQEKRGMLSLEYPIKRGVVTDWDTMEEFWKHMYYNELRAAPEEHPVLITEPPLNPKSNREKMIETFFEALEVPAFYVTLPAILSCYALGRVSAMMLDIGDSVSHILPIYEGYTIPHVIDRINLGGQDVTDYLERLVHGRGYNVNKTDQRENFREMKEKVCYSALDYGEELKISDTGSSSDKEMRYQLPDGNTIAINKERFQAGEALFDPTLIGMDCPGLHEKLFSAIMKCDMDTRKDLYPNLVISGGTTLMPGFADRLQKEMEMLIPSSMNTKVVGRDYGDVSVWIGGSVLASLSVFNKMAITKEEYMETGPIVVHRKCFEGQEKHRVFECDGKERTKVTGLS